MYDDPSRKTGSRSLLWTGLFVFLALVGMARPNFIKARATRANSCTANLKQIDGAVQLWALENQKTATDTYSLSDPTLLAYLKGSVLPPPCPDGGRYLPGSNISAAPRCTHGGPGHTL